MQIRGASRASLKYFNTHSFEWPFMEITKLLMAGALMRKLVAGLSTTMYSNIPLNNDKAVKCIANKQLDNAATE